MKITRLIAISSMLAMSAAATADGHRYQASDVIDVTGGESFYQGAAWMVRTEGGVTGRIAAKVTTAGDAYTLWAVVFNHPENCAGAQADPPAPCAESDLINPAVEGSVFFASSAISAADGGLKTNGKPAGGGVINFDFRIDAGGQPDGQFVLLPDANDFAGILDGNGYGAEVHLVVDRHPPVPEGMSWIPDLTSTNFPGAGPATNNRAAIFLACESAPCPGSVFSPY